MGEHFDVAVVGAGLSGIRSDSDMHTLGFRFQPWTDTKSIADGPAIMQYLRNTMTEHGIDQHIRFGHQVNTASWSSTDARWTVSANTNGIDVTFTCNYLFMCSGYYSYTAGHTPEFPGRERFTGQVVHPQAWPADLDYADKRVVVIGSGATAMTLVPAMANDARHVTMLQRSPTYVASAPDIDPFANRLRKLLPAKLAYDLTRRKNVAFQQMVYRRTRTQPAKVKAYLVGKVREELGPDYDVDKHFTPSYNPWDQRLCLVPNSDLFATIRSGKASVATDTITTFTETGILLSSGEHLDADIIVTATGLNLVTLGEVRFSVDSHPVDFSNTWTYKGFAYSDVPNLASTFGYINASWTLRADLISEYVCRLLRHMAATGALQCTPRLRTGDHDMPQRPWIDGFSAGYMARAMSQFPRQSNREPWINPQNYKRDKKMFRTAPVDDGVMRFAVASRTERQ